MNYIMTGSAGLIGKQLKKRLDKIGCECIMEIDLRKGSNILSLDSIRLTPTTQKTDVFFHLAAHCKINEGTNNPDLPFLNNAMGTYKALEFCRKNGIKKFVYISSSRVLSKNQNPYTASKVYGEKLCEAYRQCYGINYIIVRPSTVYGEGHDITTRLITNWCIKALKNEVLPIYGDEHKTLDFTHVDDFVDGVILLLLQWGIAKNDAYDISGNDVWRLVDVAKMLNSDVCFYEPETAQPQQVAIDISKMKRFGFKPKIKLEEGIKRLLAFYFTDGQKWWKDNE